MAFKVLIVDDAGFIRQILGSLLTELGCAVIGEARNGVEAVERARRLKPDLVFMDMVLPGKNGAEAAQDVLEAMPTCRIIAMSTATEEVVRAKAQVAGCIRFLEKPFTRDRLLQILSSLDGYKPARRPAQAANE